MGQLVKSKLWLMVGIPGSGKSTWLASHEDAFSEKRAIISRDEIRFNLLQEGDEYFSKEDEVWKEYVEQTKASLAINEDTILDATHLNESSRGKILRALRNFLKGVSVRAIVVDPGFKVAVEQNNQREGRSFVPLSVMRRMNTQYTMPTFEEGFDKICIVGQGPIRILDKEMIEK